MSEIQLFEESMDGISGFLSNRERGISIPLARVTEVNDLIYNGIYKGRSLQPHEREFLVREALTTSDFPNLFGDVLDRQVLASYKATEPVWKAFVKMSTNKDFKVSRRFAITGGDQYLAEVAEKGEYLASEREEEIFNLSVKKYGRQFDISWEALINDDLGALKDTPARFAKAAIRTEHRLVTSMYAGDEGTHVANANLYSDTDGNEINASAGALTIGYLEAALEAMASWRDDNNQPIVNRAKFLVVPPALEMTARQILTSSNKIYTGGAAGTAWPTTNVLPQYGLTLIVDPWLPILDAVSPNTGWYLFSDPGDIAALETAHLQGHERPEICMKASDKVTIGGGAIGPMSGDYATDNVLYRVRLVFGGCKLDWRATYMGGFLG